MPGDGEARMMITAGARTIAAGDSDTHSRYRGLGCKELVLTGESLPAEKLPGPFRLAGRWLS